MLRNDNFAIFSTLFLRWRKRILENEVLPGSIFTFSTGCMRAYDFLELRKSGFQIFALKNQKTLSPPRTRETTVVRGPWRPLEATEACSRAQILARYPKSSPLPTPPGSLLFGEIWRRAIVRVVDVCTNGF